MNHGKRGMGCNVTSRRVSQLNGRDSGSSMHARAGEIALGSTLDSSPKETRDTIHPPALPPTPGMPTAAEPCVCGSVLVGLLRVVLIQSIGAMRM